MAEIPPQLTTKQKLFEEMVHTGFEPLRVFIERKRLENDLSEDDIKKLMGNIEYNVINWIDWLRHQNSHIGGGGHGHE